MASHYQHRPLPTTLGLSLGFLGIAGLILSLLSLLPINIYNVYLSSTTALLLAKIEYERTQQWWLFSQETLYYFIFLVGSAVSSVITCILVMVASLTKKRRIFNNTDIEANHYSNKNKYSSILLNRYTCILFIGQISWALFGNHLLWFKKLDNEDMTMIVESTKLSVWILWLNYAVLILFSFILFCASFFIILGTSKALSSNGKNNNNINNNDNINNHMNSNNNEDNHNEMQQERTPLLNNNKSTYHN
ncbi:unnamed protein product [Cunninghamella blakesleeana]